MFGVGLKVALFLIAVAAYQIVVALLKIFGVIAWPVVIVFLPTLIWVVLCINEHFSDYK